MTRNGDNLALAMAFTLGAIVGGFLMAYRLDPILTKWSELFDSAVKREDVYQEHWLECERERIPLKAKTR